VNEAIDQYRLTPETLRLITDEPLQRVRPISFHIRLFASPTELILLYSTLLKKLSASQTRSVPIWTRSLPRCLIWVVGEHPTVEQEPVALCPYLRAPRLDWRHHVMWCGIDKRGKLEDKRKPRWKSYEGYRWQRNGDIVLSGELLALRATIRRSLSMRQTFLLNKEIFLGADWVAVDSLLVVRITVSQPDGLLPAIQATFLVDLVLVDQVQVDPVDVQPQAVLHRINRDQLKRLPEPLVVL
jgi:hypothetical protein